MNRSDLQPGDVVFPADPTGAPWVVLCRDEGRMLYLSEGHAAWWSDENDHTFKPFVLIVRGREAVNGRWP